MPLAMLIGDAGPEILLSLIHISTVSELMELTGAADRTVRTYLKKLESQELVGYEIPQKGAWRWHYLPEK